MLLLLLCAKKHHGTKISSHRFSHSGLPESSPGWSPGSSAGSVGRQSRAHGGNADDKPVGRPVVVGCTMIDMHVSTKIDDQFRVSLHTHTHIYSDVLTYSNFQWMERRDSAKRLAAGRGSSEKLQADWAPVDDCLLKVG